MQDIFSSSSELKYLEAPATRSKGRKALLIYFKGGKEFGEGRGPF